MDYFAVCTRSSGSWIVQTGREFASTRAHIRLAFLPACRHLKGLSAMKATTIFAVKDLGPYRQGGNISQGFEFSCVTPASFVWDSSMIGRSLEGISTNNDDDDDAQKTQVSIQTPLTDDWSKLQVPLPGYSPMGSLWRLKVKAPQAQPRDRPCLVLNLTLSDKSGSTVRQVGTATMRQRFNQLTEARFLKRLESIPALVAAGVGAPKTSVFSVVFRIADVSDSVVRCVEGIRSGTSNTATAKLWHIVEHAWALSSVNPGVLTDFSVGPRTLVTQYEGWLKEAQSLLKMEKVVTCSFVEFDTDGGHNGSSDYINSLRNLCSICSVRNGVVTGFGSWLNQDSASKVARVFGSVPALLSLQVPEPGTEGLDKVFCQGFSAWITTLRQPSNLTLKVSAGSVSFSTPASSRSANSIEVLGIRSLDKDILSRPVYGATDVSDETFAKASIEGVPPNKEFIIYIVSRLQTCADLVGCLKVQSISEESSTARSDGKIGSDTEMSLGNFLARD
eukprot:scaffold83_cov181-Amphora_coffeaeformis.AAC.13